MPEGMMQADLSRPVVEVKDHFTGRSRYEMYTYGEQVVVMPLEKLTGRAKGDPDRERKLARLIKDMTGVRADVTLQGNRAKVSVRDRDVPVVLGRGGSTVRERRPGRGVAEAAVAPAVANRAGRSSTRRSMSSRPISGYCWTVSGASG